MLTYLFAALAACANAASSVLQRKADSEESSDDNLSLRLIWALLHKPVWLAGVLAVIVGFLLQPAALGSGPLAVVEPVLIIELPITLVLAGFFFHQRMRRREWVATLVVIGGMAMFLLQSSLNAGPLIPAQPGFTTADPVVSILWGTLAFGETVRSGLFLLLAVLSAGVLGWGVFRLSRSPLVGGGDPESPAVGGRGGGSSPVLESTAQGDP